MDKLQRIHTGILCSNLKEWTIGTPNNMKKYHWHNNEFKIIDTRDYIPNDSIYMMSKNRHFNHDRS